MATVAERTESKRQKAMARELEWIRSSAKARQSKGQARVNAYEAMLKQDVAEQEKKFEIVIPPGPAPRQSRRAGAESSQGLWRQAALR